MCMHYIHVHTFINLQQTTYIYINELYINNIYVCLFIQTDTQTNRQRDNQKIMTDRKA